MEKKARSGGIVSMDAILTLFFILLGGCWIASGILQWIITYLSRINGVLRILFFGLAYLSKGFHAFCQLLGFYVCLIPVSLSKYRIAMIRPSGNDRSSQVALRISFCKAVLIIFCPLLMISLATTVMLLETSDSPPIIQGILWGLIILLAWYGAPSKQDWIFVGQAMRLKPWTTSRQVGEILFAILAEILFPVDWLGSCLFFGAELLWNGIKLITTLIRKLRHSHSIRVVPASIPISAIFPSQRILHRQTTHRLRKRIFRSKSPKIFRDVKKYRKKMDDLVSQFPWDDIPQNKNQDSRTQT